MDEPKSRDLGVEALRALAHPLRAQLYGALSAYGPSTASALADRFGESTGSTSYHLRQLERHGFVREDEARGNGRDRWWERVPGAINIGSGAIDEAPAVRDATLLLTDEFARAEQALWSDLRRAQATLPLEWQKAVDSSTANLELTAPELAALTREVNRVIERYRGRRDAGGDVERRRVHLQFRAFPVIDPMTGDLPDPAETDTDSTDTDFTDTATDVPSSGTTTDLPEGASR